MPNVDGTTMVIPSDLESVSRDIHTRGEAILEQLDWLEGQLAPIAGDWAGGAHTYYQGLQDMWNLSADGLFGPDGIMAIIARIMHINWVNYSEAELTNTNYWKH